jgi:hypothetical protein
MAIKLTAPDIEKMLGEKVSDYVARQINGDGLAYLDISREEHDACVRKIVNTLLDPGIIRAGEKRIDQWERGWGENLGELAGGIQEAVIPKYFGKYEIVRLNRMFVRCASRNFEYHSLCVILDWLFDKYFREASSIYEFGCGTGHNLLRARKVNPSAKMHGLDWAISSQEIIKQIVVNGIDRNMFARRFDLFNPDSGFALDNNSVVYTVAALEQVGNRFEKFVDYLLKNKPTLCVHVEPIAELLDENNLLDYLSIEYFKKRNYLNGFLSYLRKLELNGGIEIIKAQRTYIGSFFIDGYSVVVWRPKHQKKEKT